MGLLISVFLFFSFLSVLLAFVGDLSLRRRSARWPSSADGPAALAGGPGGGLWLAARGIAFGVFCILIPG